MDFKAVIVVSFLFLQEGSIYQQSGECKKETDCVAGFCMKDEA